MVNAFYRTIQVTVFICLIPFWLPISLVLLWLAHRGDIGLAEAEPTE